jgi:hypothetical protein
VLWNLPKQGAERSEALEPDVEADARDGAMTRLEEARRLLDAPSLHALHRGLSERAFEQDRCGF